MISFNIHDLVCVKIEDNVSSLIIDAIEKQIGYFKQDKTTKTKYKIIISPYRKFIDIELISQELIYCKNGKEILLLHAIQLGIVKTENGYHVYADNPNIPLIHLIHYLILRSGYTIIHSAGMIDPNNNGIIAPGVGGVGKTSLLIHLVTKFGYKLVGDDYIIIGNDGSFYSFPKKSVSLKPNMAHENPKLIERLEPSRSQKIVIKLKKFIVLYAPFKGIAEKMIFREDIIGKIIRSFSIREGIQASVDEVYGINNLVDRGKIKHIVYLQKHVGEISLKSTSPESMCQRIIGSTHNEWVDGIKILFALSAIEMENIVSYFDAVETIIKSGIERKGCWLLMIPDKITTKEIHKKLMEIL